MANKKFRLAIQGSDDVSKAAVVAGLRNAADSLEHGRQALSFGSVWLAGKLIGHYEITTEAASNAKPDHWLSLREYVQALLKVCPLAQSGDRTQSAAAFQRVLNIMDRIEKGELP